MYLSFMSSTLRARVLGLFGVEPAARIARVDRAETAGARAHGAHQHDGGGAGVPALADVRALGFLAHRREPVLVHDALDRAEARAHRQLRARSTRACGRWPARTVRARCF